MNIYKFPRWGKGKMVRLIEIGIKNILVYPLDLPIYKKLTPDIKLFGYGIYLFTKQSEVHQNTCTKEISTCINQGIDILGSNRPN